MRCIPQSFHLVAIRVNELIGSGSSHLFDSIWPFPVRTEYSLCRVFSVLIQPSEHPIADPELSYMHLLVVIVSNPLLVDGWKMLAPSFQSVDSDLSIFSRCSHAHRSARFGAWLPLSPRGQRLHVRWLKRTEFHRSLFYEMSCMPITPLVAHQPMHISSLLT